VEIDFLAEPRTKSKWMPHFWGDRYAWQVLSGEWRVSSPHAVVYRQNPAIRNGENISVVGSRHWGDFDLRLQLRFLTVSSRPPEGGAIVYFFIRNLRNYYSFHLCLDKQRVEFIKRRDGFWNEHGRREFHFAEEEDYSVEIASRGGVHECRINGTGVMAVKDRDFSRGRIGLGVKYCDLELSKVILSLASDS
jgi:hypothetical protein